MFSEFCLIGFILSFLIQLYCYLRVFYPFSKTDKKKELLFNKPLSVIIAAKDEAENLRNFLPYILEQVYPDFEIIVVDDGSSDESKTIFSKLQTEKLKVISLKETVGKKLAIQEGIKAAKNEYLIFTDADCKPASDNWLKEIAVQFNKDNQVEIVLGHGRFYKRAGLLNKLIRFEGLINAIQYFSFALAGKPYMGVGRNLAYTKTVYHRTNAFDKHKNLKGGDDDLIVNEQANSQNVAIAVSKPSHTFTEAKGKWIEYFHQKRRQLEVGEKYKANDRLRLMLFGLSNFLFYITFLALVVFQPIYSVLLTMFILKLLIQLLTFKKIMTNLGDKDLLIWIPILEFIYLMQISLIGVSTWFWKVNRWK